MKKLALALILFCSVLTSCKKESQQISQPGFMKSLEADFDLAVVGNVLLDDHSIIVACRAFVDSTPGYFFKFSNEGNLIWKKRISTKNTKLWQVYDVPGNGFLTIGYEDVHDLFFNVCQYDDDGNFISSNQIPLNYQLVDLQQSGTYQMCRLNNGNFVFSGLCGGYVFAHYTNANFDTIGQLKLYIDDGLYPRGIMQVNDSTVMMSATRAVGHPIYVDFYWTTTLIETDLTGHLRSTSDFGDSMHCESPSVLLNTGNNILAITGRMGQTFDGTGTFVGYLDDGFSQLCSGEINLVKLGNDGSFISRQGFRNYPNNGLILSSNPTADGGYILCGTVDQADEISLVSPTKIYLMKIDAIGNYQWSKVIGTQYPAFGVEALQTSDGGYFISGYEKMFNKKYTGLLIKTDDKGNY